MDKKQPSTTEGLRETFPLHRPSLWFFRSFQPVSGLLEATHPEAKFRVTIHRVMTGKAGAYLQQLCDYFGKAGNGGKGRIFATTTGIMGAAYSSQKIWRTKHYDSEVKLIRDLEGRDRRSHRKNSYLDNKKSLYRHSLHSFRIKKKKESCPNLIYG